MYTFEDIGKMLDEICEEIPQPFFEKLNGGVNLLPGAKMHEMAVNDDLYIMGEYHRGVLGRFINIYYGSVIRSCPGHSPARMRQRLKKLLLHEFTHHLESLAGERGLERKDEQRLGEYRAESPQMRRRPLARRRPSEEPRNIRGKKEPGE